ncbi:MAG: Ni/Fe-hydrogenase, b-type cytochrome subunit [Desulfuromonadales bacterium]|nr:Ni/Fe-hydrogenase, b-type cytochrome subunit [Desulfuromonadales bacterium]NIS43286.1 Ni/Fe-hydrogenase, b-type cytochrome subunit [Desulfuromonadales bacterium]
MLEIHYVWEWPVRITHWMNMISIVVLSLTGFYIGDPVLTSSETTAYYMGWARFVHFAFAYLFLVSMLVRIIWMFMGNQHASWRAFFPWVSARGRKNFVKMLRYYTFTGKQISYDVGHNPVAAVAYGGVFTMFIVQILSGFALYGQVEPGGFWDTAVGWLLPIFGNQALRLTHHLVMWLLLAFVVNHIYSAWLMDVKERNGTISGIFGGCKYVEPEDL